MKGKYKNHLLNDLNKNLRIEELSQDDPRVIQGLQESQLDLYEVLT